jgi:hypothetical protein
VSDPGPAVPGNLPSLRFLRAALSCL